jgi:hypothetical protein
MSTISKIYHQAMVHLKNRGTDSTARYRRVTLSTVMPPLSITIFREIPAIHNADNSTVNTVAPISGPSLIRMTPGTPSASPATVPKTPNTDDETMPEHVPARLSSLGGSNMYIHGEVQFTTILHDHPQA